MHTNRWDNHGRALGDREFYVNESLTSKLVAFISRHSVNDKESSCLDIFRCKAFLYPTAFPHNTALGTGHPSCYRSTNLDLV